MVPVHKVPRDRVGTALATRNHRRPASSLTLATSTSATRTTRTRTTPVRRHRDLTNGTYDWPRCLLLRPGLFTRSTLSGLADSSIVHGDLPLQIFYVCGPRRGRGIGVWSLTPCHEVACVSQDRVLRLAVLNAAAVILTVGPCFLKLAAAPVNVVFGHSNLQPSMWKVTLPTRKVNRPTSPLQTARTPIRRVDRPPFGGPS
jgi:hypothetical protein